jgi:hypothetical protein
LDPASRWTTSEESSNPTSGLHIGHTMVHPMVSHSVQTRKVEKIRQHEISRNVYPFTHPVASAASSHESPWPESHPPNDHRSSAAKRVVLRRLLDPMAETPSRFTNIRQTRQPTHRPASTFPSSKFVMFVLSTQRHPWGGSYSSSCCICQLDQNAQATLSMARA